jgi:tripartite-type tricarboxylate transporter receptor subunit TctC
MQPWTKRRSLQTIGAFALAGIGTAGAQEAWPSKRITLVVGYPPGGGSDTMARLAAAKMSLLLGQPIVIDNRPGAAGQLAGTYVAKSPADGYTLLIDASSYAINLGLGLKGTFNAQSFVTVGLLAMFPLVVVTNPAFAARNMADVLALAKAKPGAVLYASAGSGTVQHIFGEMLMQASNIEITHVPYKGAAPAMTDVMGGQVQLFFANAGAALPLIQAGKLRALAVTGDSRLSQLPDVPTIAETPVGRMDLREWIGMFAPAGTPASILERLSDALRRSLDYDDVKARVTAISGEPFTASRLEAAKFVDGQVASMAKIIRERGIKAE